MVMGAVKVGSCTQILSFVITWKHSKRWVCKPCGCCDAGLVLQLEVTGIQRLALTDVTETSHIVSVHNCDAFSTISIDVCISSWMELRLRWRVENLGRYGIYTFTHSKERQFTMYMILLMIVYVLHDENQNASC
jgi:hypothetical protein